MSGTDCEKGSLQLLCAGLVMESFCTTYVSKWEDDAVGLELPGARAAAQMVGLQNTEL